MELSQVAPSRLKFLYRARPVFPSSDLHTHTHTHTHSQTSHESIYILRHTCKAYRQGIHHMHAGAHGIAPQHTVTKRLNPPRLQSQLPTNTSARAPEGPPSPAARGTGRRARGAGRAVCTRRTTLTRGASSPLTRRCRASSRGPAQHRSGEQSRPG